ncbi:MAG: hypothetical protein ACRDE2_17770, partial [Chitinophagaceae bacterium]
VTKRSRKINAPTPSPKARQPLGSLIFLANAPLISFQRKCCCLNLNPALEKKCKKKLDGGRKNEIDVTSA